jgi:hypothetical protein
MLSNKLRSLVGLMALAGLGCGGSTLAEVGDTVPNSTPGGPPGTVTEVTPAGNRALGTNTATGTATTAGPYQWVSISFPAPWTCPAQYTGKSYGASGPYFTATGYGVYSATVTAYTTSTTGAADRPELTPQTCEGLAALRRPALRAQARSSLEGARSRLLAQNCTGTTERRCQDGWGRYVEPGYCLSAASTGTSTGYRSADAGASYAMPGATATASGTGTGASASTGGAAGAGGATQYSTTNNQVATVDEADYVKNDSGTIFVLSADGLRVIDAWPAAETRQIAKLAIPGEPRRLFLEGNRLVVYTRMQASGDGSGHGAGSSNPSDQGCTYGYGCRFSSEGGHTMAIVLDVTKPAAPRELARYEFSGGYVASRRVGQFVYTVVHDTGAPQVPGLDYSLSAGSYEELQARFEERVAANDAIIDATGLEFFLPWMKRTAADGSVATGSSCAQALATQSAAGLSFVSLIAFDLTQLDAPARTVVASNAGWVYASPSALYLAVDRAPERDYASSYYYYAYQPVDTVVHKFAMAGTETRYVGSGLLPGHILNQFAMDEHLGVLRVASTRGWLPDSNVQSYITTFGEQGGGLVQLGQLGGIAPTEDIRSVRFDGDRGFVVTFKKTDPLFVFDLADPAAPRVLGELKIPGFSTYMHRLDANHILAVGFDADEMGSFAYFDGIQIQIFDVTDLAHPTLMWKHVIGTRGSNSEALTNHLAFNYFAPRKMLALPVTVCEGGGNGAYGGRMTFAGLMAFDISLETGITEHGRLPFVDPSAASAGYSTCGQWWTDSKSLVKRSIFMDDWVYGLSDAQLRVAALASMSTPLQTVSLTGP